MKKKLAGAVRFLLTLACFGACRAETPDFFADILSSDGVGHVDLEYTYKAGVTSSVTCDLHIVRRGLGDRELPLESGLVRGLFGYWGSAHHISAFRIYGQGTLSSDALQCWGTNWNYKATHAYNSDGGVDLGLALDYAAAK